ncbi:hypothetical protein BgAZ_400440 [Babesia gibsoni]|uniref:50S ribosomal protein L35 n=1 Tax=Babesia gibsoni TaxID=33632 RepID=A0AAD8LJK0_BABGI|nr:hypothetical protein BgAZ_400440 [Babesia gibsoni]
MLLAHTWSATSVAIYRNEARIGHSILNHQAFICENAFIPKNRGYRDNKLNARRMYKLKLRASGQFRIKPKTNKSVAKRFKITATGKIMYKRAGRSHLQRKKSQGAKRRLRRPVQLKSPRLIRKILSVLHNR